MGGCAHQWAQRRVHVATSALPNCSTRAASLVSLCGVGQETWPAEGQREASREKQ